MWAKGVVLVSFFLYCDLFANCVQAWVDFAVKTVESGNLQGVFIDGFQGCDPYASNPTSTCGMVLKNCTAEARKVWVTGLNTSLWELRARLGKNKTIVCNGTGGMYRCNGKLPCFCDGANKERFYGNAGDLEQVREHGELQNGTLGALVHVPHIDVGLRMFNKSLAGFLATGNLAEFQSYHSFLFACLLFRCQLVSTLDMVWDLATIAPQEAGFDLSRSCQNLWESPLRLL
jgi:hypothetical protein